MRRTLVLCLESAAALALAGCFLTAAAAGGPIYHWVTDDGTYAFADDRKKIPARYKAVAATQKRRSLKGYSRFTPADTPKRASGSPAAPFDQAAAPVQFGSSATTVSIRSGGPQSQRIDITPRPDEGPVVIEKRRFKADGTSVTRTYTIVRQGDRILTVIKPQPHETNVSDFGNEADFEID